MEYHTGRNIPRLLILFIAGLAWAAQALGQLSATVTSASQTQAVLQEQGFSGACTIAVSTSPSLTPLHPDLNGAEYSGANTDTGRADTISSTDGLTRLVTIGHQNDDRALAAFTAYYYQVSGCGGTVAGSFTTANLSTGTTRTEETPFNPAKWGNLGLPSFDWTTKRSYVDPMTGSVLIPMATSIQTYRTGCGSGGCSSSSRQFTDWSGGAGWTNPAGVRLGATSTAIASNINPLDLYADLSGGSDPLPYDWHRVLEDVGVVVWGGANSAASTDRVIDLCIFLNPTAGCASNTVQVTLPLGSVTHVTSGSTDADGAFPAAFPSSPFFGWTQSSSPLIHMENRETFGTAAVSGSTLTLGSMNGQQHFSSALSAGQKVFIAGSACANNLCTAAASPSGPNAMTLVETPGVGSAAFRAYGWGIRVWKDTPNGTASVGLNFKLAGSNSPIGIESGGDKCSSVQVTSGDGKQGFLCALTSAVSGLGWLAFIATDGTTRILSSRSGFSFDDVQGNVFYAGARNANGGWTINKYTYTGNYITELNYNYTCSSAGDCPNVNDNITSTDLMPHTSNVDLDQQIEANQGVSLPPYNAAIYGPWTQSNGTVAYYGSSGHFAFFCNLYAGQGQLTSGGPGWCASVDISQSPARVVRLIHTLDGTGAPNARFGSLHSPQQVDSNPNTLFLSLDDLNSNNTSTLHGGPYQAPVVGLMMADGTWNTNTCLDWPPTGGSSCGGQNYNRACPSGSSPYTECVTFRLPQNGVCNTAATTIEKTTWPCPWNASYSQHPLIQAGDNAMDMSRFGGTDSEHFRILSTAPDAGNTLRVTAARNSVYDYCSLSPWHGQVDPLSVDIPSQFQHPNGWTLTMMPGTVNTCGAAVLLQDQVTGSVQELGRSVSGHFQTGRGPTGINFVTSAKTIYDTAFSNLGQVPPIFNVTGDPAFHGIPALLGAQLQSYSDDSQLNAGAPGYTWAIDMNPFVSCSAENLGCGLPRSLMIAGGTVYKIQAIGSASASNANYKTQPMIGWAGRYQLKEVSGPASSVDSTPYSMCFTLIAGECHAGSVANEIYVNVPAAYDPGYCSASFSWVNIPCVLMGDNAPAGGLRQFRITQGDTNGAYSRFISNGWSSVGRHYPFTHGTVYQTGNWAMLMGTNSIDGFSMTGFMISLPPWVEKRDPDNDFKAVIVQIPRGPRFAEIQFGYSRYIGPNNAPQDGFFCTPRADGCNTSSASLFNFESEVRTDKGCIAGCRFTIPAVAPNLMYYRIRRSADGVTWTSSDTQAIALE